MKAMGKKRHSRCKPQGAAVTLLLVSTLLLLFAALMAIGGCNANKTKSARNARGTGNASDAEADITPPIPMLDEEALAKLQQDLPQFHRGRAVGNCPQAPVVLKTIDLNTYGNKEEEVTVPAVCSDQAILLSNRRDELWILDATSDQATCLEDVASPHLPPVVSLLRDHTVLVSGKRSMYCIDLSKKLLLWEHPIPEVGDWSDIQNLSRPVSDGEYIYFSLSDTKEIYRLTLAGQVESLRETQALTWPMFGSIGADGTYYFGDQSGRLYALSRESSTVWSLLLSRGSQRNGQSAPPFESPPCIGYDDSIYQLTNDGVIALRCDGNLSWRYEPDGASSYHDELHLTSTGYLLFVGKVRDEKLGFIQHIFCVDPRGHECWRTRLDFNAGIALLSADDVLVVGSLSSYGRLILGETVAAFNTDGKELWRIKPGGDWLIPVGITDTATLYVLDFGYWTRCKLHVLGDEE